MQKALWYQVIKMIKSSEIHSKDLFYFIGDPLDLRTFLLTDIIVYGDVCVHENRERKSTTKLCILAAQRNVPVSHFLAQNGTTRLGFFGSVTWTRG